MRYGNVNAGVDVRDEIYCLLMKQTTANPGAQSVNQAWKLFGLCIQFFSPGDDLSNYVHIFIRRNAPSHLKQKLIDAMYIREYGGSKPSPPGVDQIPSLISEYQ